MTAAFVVLTCMVLAHPDEPASSTVEVGDVARVDLRRDQTCPDVLAAIPAHIVEANTCADGSPPMGWCVVLSPVGQPR